MKNPFQGLKQPLGKAKPESIGDRSFSYEKSLSGIETLEKGD